MPKRKTVQLQLTNTLLAIKRVCRNNTAFCEKMERSSKWVTDWKRGKNLPSPEEAARMCVLLNVSPEELLIEPADVELVHSLLPNGISPVQSEGSVNPNYYRLNPNKRAIADAMIDLLLQFQSDD